MVEETRGARMQFNITHIIGNVGEISRAQDDGPKKGYFTARWADQATAEFQRWLRGRDNDTTPDLEAIARAIDPDAYEKRDLFIASGITQGRSWALNLGRVLRAQKAARSVITTIQNARDSHI
jgi:hypothetical protein